MFTSKVAAYCKGAHRASVCWLVGSLENQVADIVVAKGESSTAQ